MPNSYRKKGQLPTVGCHVLKHTIRLWEKNKISKRNNPTFHNHFVTHPLLSRKSSLTTLQTLLRTKSLACYVYILTIKHPFPIPQPTQLPTNLPKYIYLPRLINFTDQTPAVQCAASPLLHQLSETKIRPKLAGSHVEP